MAYFQPGNTIAPGGTRENAGRPKKAVVEAITHELATYEVQFGKTKEGRPESIPMGLAAIRVMATALTGQFVDPQVMNVQLKAADMILNRLIGKPKQSMDLNLNGSLGIMQLIAQVGGPALSHVADISALAEQGSTSGGPALPEPAMEVPSDGDRGRKGQNRKPPPAGGGDRPRRKR